MSGPWWCSSGQRAYLILRVRIPLKSTILIVYKLLEKNEKEAGNGPLKIFWSAIRMPKFLSIIFVQTMLHWCGILK